MTSAIRLKQTIDINRELSDDIEDAIMVMILVIIPCAYLFLARIMWINYEALKDKESPESFTYGNFS